jgi:hypothetical protein
MMRTGSTIGEGKDRSKPFSIRLTDAERRLLEERAGRQPVGLYVRNLALSSQTRSRRSSGHRPIPDTEALARVLGLLGNSAMADSLKRIADAAVLGTDVVDRETRRVIRRACDDIARMRYLLLKALGLRTDSGILPGASLSETFAFHAGKTHP